MYKTVADENGTGTITWTVTDNGSSTSPNVNSITETLAVTINSVNDAPTGTSKTIAIVQNGNKTFSSADFGFADAADSPANAFKAVIITALPGAGTLTLGGTVVSVNQNIPVGSLGTLVYTPALNGNGNNYATIGFKVQDDGGTANLGADTSTNAYTLTIDVTAVNDAPTIAVAPSSFTVTEDVAGKLTFTGTPFADVDSTNLTITLSVADGTISALSSGGITVGGTATARTFTGTISALNTYFTTAGNITYQGALDANGTRTLTIQADDGSSANNLTSTTTTINITAVNDAPVRTGTMPTLTVNEDSSNTNAVSLGDRKSTRLNSSHVKRSRMPSSA